MHRSSIVNLAKRRGPIASGSALRGVATILSSAQHSLYSGRNHAAPITPCQYQPPIRAFHSSGDFADYMKQVMSPMTGHVGEQTPSEESNTLREIDRLFTIISST